MVRKVDSQAEHILVVKYTLECRRQHVISVEDKMKPIMLLICSNFHIAVVCFLHLYFHPFCSLFFLFEEKGN